MARRNILKTVRNVVLSIIMLLLLFAAAGVAYVRFVGNNSKQASIAKTTPPPSQLSLPAAHKPDPKAPVGVALQSLYSPVKAGQNTSISVKTTPQAKCTIKVTYDGKPSTDSGLAPKFADNYGSATWSWTVEKSVPKGKWPVAVTCVYNKHSGFLQKDLQVD
ncbi:MAG TPA: hypothetical protein VFW52_00800 [Candidatus Saccharimonadales bacterium]|nr:hypothetical protein [Candidatus Saccharimonadales bacterium]